MASSVKRFLSWGRPEGIQDLYQVNPLSGYTVLPRDLEEVHLAALVGDMRNMKVIINFHKHTLDNRDCGGNRTALHFACVNGHQEIVLLLVESDCQLDLFDSENRTPLMKAVQCQEEDCASILLEHCANPNLMDIYGSSALHYAVYCQNLSIAAKLLAHKANIEATNKEGFTPLLLAVGKNKQKMVPFLINKGANVHAVDTMKRTTLMLAVSYNAPHVIKLLLQEGVDVFCQDSFGRTVKDHALRYDFKDNQEIILEYLAERTSEIENSGMNDYFGTASSYSKYQLTTKDPREWRTSDSSRNSNQGDRRKPRMSMPVRSFKKVGSKVKRFLNLPCPKDLEESYRVNPLSGYAIHVKDLKEIHKVAIEGDQVKMDHIITFQSCTLNNKDRKGRTALHFACANGHQEIVIQLVDAKCRLNLFDDENRTPLIKAVQCQQEECVSVLLKHHASPSLMDIYKNTALHYAAYNKNIEIAAELLSFRADIEAKNKIGFTPLLAAVSKNNQSMVEFLINKGANVHAIDFRERTALMIAVSNEAPGIVRLLVRQGVDIFCQDASGKTAKDHAAHYGFKINHQLISEYLTEKITSVSCQNNNQGMNGLAENSLNSTCQLLPEDRGQEPTNNSQNNSQVKTSGDKTRESPLNSVSEKPVIADFWPTSTDGLLAEPKPSLEPCSAQRYPAAHQFNENAGANYETMREEDKMVLESIPSEGEIDDDIELFLTPCSVRETPRPDAAPANCSTLQSPLSSAVTLGLANPSLEPCSAQRYPAAHQFNENAGANYETMREEDKMVLESIPSEGEIDDDLELFLTPCSVQETPRPDVVAPANCSTLQNPLSSAVTLGLANEVAAKHASGTEQSGSDTVSASSQQIDADNSTSVDEAHKSHRCDMKPALEEEDNKSSFKSKVHVGQLFEPGDQREKIVLNEQKHGRDDKSDKTSLNRNEATRFCYLSPSLSRRPDTDVSWRSSEDDFNFEFKTTPNIDVSKPKPVPYLEGKSAAACDTVRIENKTLFRDSDNRNNVEIKTSLKSSVQEVSYPDTSLPELSSLPSHPKSLAICYLPNEETSRNENVIDMIQNALRDRGTNKVLISVDETHKSNRCGVSLALEPGEEDSSGSSCDSKCICENAEQKQKHVSDLPAGSHLSTKHAADGQESGGDTSKETSPNRGPDPHGFWSSSDDNSNSEHLVAQNPDFSKMSVIQVKEQFFSSVGPNCYALRVENSFLFKDSCSDSGNCDEIETGVKPSVQEGSHPDASLPELPTLPSHPKSLAICHLQNQKHSEDAAQKHVGKLPGASDQRGKQTSNAQEEREDKSEETSVNSLSRKPVTDDSSSPSNDDCNFEPKTILKPSLTKEMSAIYQLKEKSGASCNTKRANNRSPLESSSSDDKIEIPLKPPVKEISHPDITSSKVSTVPHHAKSLSICSVPNKSCEKDAQNYVSNFSGAADQREKHVLKGQDNDLSTDEDSAVLEEDQQSLDESESDYPQRDRAVQKGWESYQKTRTSSSAVVLPCDTTQAQAVQTPRHKACHVKARQNQKRKCYEIQESKRIYDASGDKHGITHQEKSRNPDNHPFPFLENKDSERPSLKKEVKTKTSGELCEELRQQLRETKERYGKETEQRQLLELTLQSLNVEMNILKTALDQATEERDDTRRLLAIEQKARALQEIMANSQCHRQKELEESYKKVKSMVYEGNKKKKDLLHRNHILQDKVVMLKQELKKLNHQSQEKERKYFEDAEVLKGKNDALQATIEHSKEAVTEKMAQYIRQLNTLKEENTLLTIKLEDEEQNKARLEKEVESYCSRLTAALRNQGLSQISKKDLEQTFQRAKDEWHTVQDKMTSEMSRLKASNKILSRQLSKAESKSNSLETELRHKGDVLGQKTSIVECLQKELHRIHCQKKELEQEYENQQHLVNKHVRKQEDLEEQVSRMQSKNELLQQQLDDAHSRANKKEKTVTSTHNGSWDIKKQGQAEPENRCLTLEERNRELVIECNRLKEIVCRCEKETAQKEELLRQLEQKLSNNLKKQPTSDISSETMFHYRIKLEDEGKDSKKKDDLSSQLQTASSKYRHLDAQNQVLQRKLLSMQAVKKKCGKLETHNNELKQEIVNLNSHIGKMMVEHSQLEQYKEELEERAQQNLAEILTGVEVFLQKRAASPTYLEQLRNNRNSSMSSEVNLRVKNLESEFSKMKISHEASKEAEIEKCKVQIDYLKSELGTMKLSQEMSKKAELGKCEPLLLEKVNKNSLENKLKWTHEDPAEKLGAKYVERDQNRPSFSTPTSRPGLDPFLVGSCNYTSLALSGSYFARETTAGSTPNLWPSNNSRESHYLTKVEECVDAGTAGELAEDSMRVESGTKDFLI